MKTEVSFSAAFAAPDADDADKNRALADFFVGQLMERGYLCSRAEDIDYGFAFRCVVEKRDFYLIVGLVKDEDSEWLISTNSALGWFQKLIGKKDEVEHRLLTKALHDILTQHPQFSAVRWYTLQEWNTDPAKGGVLPDELINM